MRAKLQYWMLKLLMKCFQTRDTKEINKKSLAFLKASFEIIERLIIFSIGLVLGFQDTRILIGIVFLVIAQCLVFIAIKLRERMPQ